MAGQTSPMSIFTRLQRVATLSREHPQLAWTTLAHHIDIEALREAFRGVRRNGAPGVDGQTVADYEANLEDNLLGLLDRFKTGTYRAAPVRRVYIPKDDGRKRPLGIPTVEDKILQRAVTTLLNAVYEQDFLDCSYGFRPGRSAHQALEHLRKGLMKMHGGWVIEIDIESFFDKVSHEVLRSFLDKRIRDGVIRRAIGKWLRAGVMENGVVRQGDEGTPQGGVISPLLANLYLHEVLDVWFARDVLPRMGGMADMVRYADDAVLIFSREDDARRVFAVLAKRFEKYGLRLHPKKTRLVPFERPPKFDRTKEPPRTRPGSFDFLGFTHFWGKSRKGNRVIKQTTSKKRLSRGLKRINEWCRRNRHLPVPQQRAALALKLSGHYGYYGITGNFGALAAFYDEVRRRWQKWLSRRSWRARMPWDRFHKMIKRYPLPTPRVVHSYV